MEDKKSATMEMITEAPLDLNAPVSAQLHRMSPDDWRQQFVEDHMNCLLCGNELQFSHHTNFSTLDVEEEAHCLACKMQTRTNHYCLQ